MVFSCWRLWAVLGYSGLLWAALVAEKYEKPQYLLDVVWFHVFLEALGCSGLLWAALAAEKYEKPIYLLGFAWLFLVFKG